MKHKVILLGECGVGKSTCGLSYPRVSQHVWGSTEEDTAIGFKGRKDILPPVKFNWRDCLTDAERLLFDKPDEKKDILVRHKERLPATNKAKARNVAKYIDYLEELNRNVGEVGTVFLDNFTPFSEDLWTYTEMLHSDDYSEKTQFKIHMDYQNYLTHVIDLLVGMDCHTVVSCHVQMAFDEETAAKVGFTDKNKPVQLKQWQPYLMGKYKFRLAGKFTFAFYLFTEENPGLATKYLAKLEADSNNVGIGKARIQPFDKPNKIVLPKGTFYQFLEDALSKQQTTGGK